MLMKNLINLFIICLLASCHPQRNDLEKVDELLETRFDKTLFTAFAWLNLGQYTPEDTAGMDPVIREVFTLTFEQLDSLEIQSIKEEYRKYEESYGRMFDYILTIFSLNCTQPPVIETLYDELKAWGDSIGKPDNWSLKRIQELEPLAASLTHFYRDAEITEVATRVQPVYDSVAKAYRQLAVQKLSDAMVFTGASWESLDRIEKVVIIPNLLGSPGEMGPEYKGVKYDIKGPKSQVVFYTHEFVHSIVHPLLEEPDVKERIHAFVGSQLSGADTTPAWKSYPEPGIFFEECLVRALDAHIMNMGKDDGPEKIRKYLDFEESRGFIFCHQISSLLRHFDPAQSQLSDLINEILQ